jgi:hypothetical protein
MRRKLFQLGCLFLISACGGAVRFDEDTGAASSASTSVPRTSVPIVHTTTPPPPSACTASTIAWTVGGVAAPAAQSTCAGGFEYTAYVTPCSHYCCGSDSNPSTSCSKDCHECGAPIGYQTKACNWPSNCRKAAYGVERKLPDEVDTTREHVNSNSNFSCADYENDLISQWSNGLPPNPGDNWGVPAKGYAKVSMTGGWTPDSAANYYGPGTIDCTVTFTGVVQYFNFTEYNQLHNYAFNPADQNQNTCPIDYATPEQCTDTTKPNLWPNCRNPDFGVDVGGCGNQPTAYSAAGTTLDAFQTQYPRSTLASQSCTSVEDYPLGAPADPQNLPDPLVTSSPAVHDGASPAGLAQAKLAAIQARIAQVEAGAAPSSTFDGDLRTELVGNAKLLFELEGEYLTMAQQDAIWELSLGDDSQASCEASAWAPDPALSPVACTTSIDAPPEANTWGAYMQNALNECTTLGTAHTSVGAATAWADRCLALAAQIPAADTTEWIVPPCVPSPGHLCTAMMRKQLVPCQYQPYRDKWRAMALPLIQKVVSGLKIHTVPSTTVVVAPDPAVQAVLAEIEHWYEGARTAYPADKKALFSDAGMVIGGMWQAAERPSVNAVDPTNAKASQIFLDNTLDVQLQVLDAAASPGPSGAPPLVSAPLLFLLGDVAQTMSGRLEYSALFHDLACRFKGCTGLGTQVSEMWKILATVADSTQLAGALKDAANIQPAWKSALGALSTNHAQSLEAAVLDATGQTTYASTLLSTGNATTVAPPALSLSQAIQGASTHAASYAATGLLGTTAYVTGAAGAQLADSSNLLNMGLQDVLLGTNSGTTSLGNTLPTLAQNMTTTANLLGQYIHDYQANEQVALNGILGKAGVAKQDQELAAQIEQVEAQFAFLSREIAGFQDSDAKETAAYGDFMTAFDGVVKGDSVDKSLQVQRKYVTATVSPVTSSRGVGSGFSDITSVSIAPGGGSTWPAGGAPLQVKQGMVLNVGTSGKWTPTCALRQATIPDPANPKMTLSMSNTANAQTGPEGYYLSISGSNVTAGSNSSVDSHGDFESVSTDAKACAGWHAQGGLDTMVGGSYGYFDASICDNADMGYNNSSTHTSTNSTGTQGATTASFSSGIRVNGTPFPNAPAGALLLVQMTPGLKTPGDVLDVQVVQGPNMSVVAAADADVYLVANDVGGCTFASPGSLTVSLYELEQAGPLFKAVGDGMVAALTHMKQREAGLIAQGKILPDDMAALRATATSDLTSATPANLTLPPSLTALFGAWVDAEVVHIERVVEINFDKYQRELLLMQLAALQNDIAANGTLGRYQTLLEDWALINMNNDQTIGIQASLTGLLQLATQELYPAAALKYPDAITTIRNSLANPLNTLSSGLDWTSIDVTQASAALQLVQSIQGIFSSAVMTTPNQQKFIQVALTFPNPAYPVPLGQPPSSQWNQADPATSAAVWAAAKGGTVMSLTLKPEDVYRLSGAAILPCTKAVPVIDTMALYLGLQSTDFSGAPINAAGGIELPINAAATQGFATSTGLEMYAFADPRWLSGADVYLLAGYAPNALADFTSALAKNPGQYTVGAGLSPFTTFNLDFSALPAVLAQAALVPTEITLLLGLETEPLASPLPWVSTCGASPTSAQHAATK